MNKHLETVNLFLQKKIRYHISAQSTPRYNVASLIGAAVVVLATLHAQEAATNPGDPGNAVNSHLSNNVGLIYAQIEESEYAINWQPTAGAHMTPNRAQNLRFTFHDDGFTVEPRELEDLQAPWRATLRLESYGKAGGPAKHMEAPSWAVHANQAEVKGEEFTISYNNDKQGMRQDFLIARKPAGSGPLRLEFVLDRDGVNMDVDQAGNFMYLLGGESGTEVMMRYRDLKAFDANERPLDAWLIRLDDDRFAIVVDDQGAQYPLVVDPLSTDGNIRNPSSGSKFGYCVAPYISYNTVSGLGIGGILVGAPYFDPGTASQAGKAFLYLTVSGALPTSWTWSYAGTVANTHVGWSIADAGNLNTDYGFHSIVVGAPGYTGTYTHEGAAYIFYSDTSNNFAPAPDLPLPGGQAGANMGYSVAGASDVSADGFDDVLVGSPNYNQSGGYGRAQVFYADSINKNALHSTADWTVYATAGGSLGWSVAFAGNVHNGFNSVVVGAPTSGTGVVYVYEGISGGGLHTTPGYTLTGENNGDYFGFSVAGNFNQNGDSYMDILVGAPYYTSYPYTQQGKAYLFRGSGTGVSTTATWTKAGTQNYEDLGYSVAGGEMNGDAYDDLMIGAPGYNSLSYTADGAAFFYVTDNTTFLPASTASLVLGQSNGVHLGSSVAYAQKLINGGKDIIVGAPDGGTTYQNLQIWKWIP